MLIEWVVGWIEKMASHRIPRSVSQPTYQRVHQAERNYWNIDHSRHTESVCTPPPYSNDFGKLKISRFLGKFQVANSFVS